MSVYGLLIREREGLGFGLAWKSTSHTWTRHVKTLQTHLPHSTCTAGEAGRCFRAGIGQRLRPDRGDECRKLCRWKVIMAWDDGVSVRRARPSQYPNITNITEKADGPGQGIKSRMRNHCGWLSLSHENGEKLQEGDSVIRRRWGICLFSITRPFYSCYPHPTAINARFGRAMPSFFRTCRGHHFSAAALLPSLHRFLFWNIRPATRPVAPLQELIPPFDNHGINAILAHITSPRPPSVPPSLRRARSKQSADIILKSTLPPPSRPERRMRVQHN